MRFNFPDPNAIQDLSNTFSALNPGMSPQNSPDEYIAFWNISINIQNLHNINALDKRLLNMQRQINVLEGKVDALEKKLKKIEKNGPDLLKD